MAKVSRKITVDSELFSWDPSTNMMEKRTPPDHNNHWIEERVNYRFESTLGICFYVCYKKKLYSVSISFLFFHFFFLYYHGPYGTFTWMLYYHFLMSTNVTILWNIPCCMHRRHTKNWLASCDEDQKRRPFSPSLTSSLMLHQLIEIYFLKKSFKIGKKH